MSTMANTYATITARAAAAGLHHWPDAPRRRLYLREPHRHLFIARATLAVDHDERDVEFHDLGDALTEALVSAAPSKAMGQYGSSLHDFGAQSCEALARHCLLILSLRYKVLAVSVSEDDEFSATVHVVHPSTQEPA